MSVATIRDLPLELVEKIARHLDVKDVLRLVMVNKWLYSSYAMDQSIVFGKHVAVVALGQDSELKNWMKKFLNSPSYQLNATLLPFAKRIDSCDELDVYFDADWTDGMFLGQLKSVNQLVFDVDTKEDCLKFLTNFCGSVKKNATLGINIGSFEQDQAMKEQLGKFIENQLNECEKIILADSMQSGLPHCFHVYHEAMMKTQIKMLSIEIWQWEFDQIVDWIVNQGIPSKNSQAVIHIVIVTPKRFSGVDFLSPVQGLQRVDDGENHSALVSRANELLRGNELPLVFPFDKNSSCFRRRIDSTTSCIYVFHKFGLQFLAFYMPSQ